MRFTQADGLEVITKNDARHLGGVRGLLVDAESGRVRAVRVERGKDDAIVEWSDVVGFGPDAVVVADAERMRAAATPWEQRFVRGELGLRRQLVLTAEGDSIGRLRDVEFDERTGRIEAIVTDRGQRSAPDLVCVGPDAIVVRRPAR